MSLGLRQGSGKVRLSAISHSATFKNQSRVADAIENAMEEAIDQGTSVAHPPIARTERAVTMAHRALAEVVRLPGAALLSVAFADSEGKPLGALTFERHARAELLSGAWIPAARRSRYFARLASECCTCGCELSVHDCLEGDASCARSPELAEAIGRSLLR